MKVYGVWCLDKNNNRGDWLRDDDRALDGGAILAFERKRDACERARDEYGFDTYTQAKRNGWVEVRRLN